MLGRRILVGAALFYTGLGLLSPAAVLAADTTFNQNILPLDCVFETVDAGSGLLYYVTPRECGVLVDNPDGGSVTSPLPATDSQKPVGPISPGTIAVVPGSTSRRILLPGGWHPLTAIAKAESTRSQPDNSVAAAVGISLFAVVLVVAALVL